MIKMGSLCVEAITDAMKILVNDDEDMIAKVNDVEEEIDQLER